MTRPPQSLEGLAEQHARALAHGKRTTAASVRRKARTLVALLNLEVPAWAVAAPKRERAPRERAPRAVLPHEAEQAEPGNDGPAQPFDLPAALRSWRAAGSGRVVNIRRDGSVRLVTFAANDGARQEAAFADLRTAERALLLGVTWRSTVKAEPKRALGSTRPKF